MSAQTVAAFGQAAAQYKKDMIFRARAIKDRIAQGEDVDITDDAEW